MSHAKAKRYWMKWQRYTRRHPEAGPRNFVYYRGYVMAYTRVSETGRYAPNGIRSPWLIPLRRKDS